jgi:hypothetical protein
MKLRLVEFHGIPWNFMELREFKEFHEIRFRQGSICSLLSQFENIRPQYI